MRLRQGAIGQMRFSMVLCTDKCFVGSAGVRD